MSVPESVPDGRSYYRVSTFLPVRCRYIDASELSGLEARILTRESLDLSQLDPGLCVWLDRIEEKLDRILSHYESEDGSWITPEGPLQVVLSGSGICFPVSEEVPVGCDLLVEIILPGTPKHTVRCIGRVARCGIDEKRIEVGVSFRVISESDQKAVVAHVLEIQRTELRRRATSE